MNLYGGKKTKTWSDFWKLYKKIKKGQLGYVKRSEPYLMYMKPSDLI